VNGALETYSRIIELEAWTAPNLQPASSKTQTYYIHADHLNTPRVISNNARQVVWRWDNLDPFGVNAPDENPGGIGTFTCNLRFPGQYFDRETNLHYNYFRDYDPWAGRYVESDPIGLIGGLNTYLYARANPARYSDPRGLKPWYGNYCGPGDNAPLPAIDCVDTACKRHDDCYKDCGVDAYSRWRPVGLISLCALRCDLQLSLDHRDCKNQDWCRRARPSLPPLPTVP
jgi:RHS repeat-associated protein